MSGLPETACFRGTNEAYAHTTRANDECSYRFIPPAQVRWEGISYETLAVCVDRYSGSIVGIPCLNKGFTGAKIAKAMLQYQLRPFGIPAKISSDQGSHFTGGVVAYHVC